ncbi:hypothetical protein [Methylomagnum ishizawai]|uniref:hypothetical protein n=1 Tax=Methylomagnum ishizawai TaxID=1760988 RepID=UPI001C385646|nr:hypothetical protein [Methylomagnum ishizawai]
MKSFKITYYRYVDDVLMYGDQSNVESAYKSLGARLRYRGLSLHRLAPDSDKSHITPVTTPFTYLGYYFCLPKILVRTSTVEHFLQSLAAKFSDYIHNKAKRLEQKKYLSETRLSEIFLSELNERITGAISEKKRYGWIAYYNQITDIPLLHWIDRAIAGMFRRLIDFEHKAPANLKKLSRAYFEMKFNIRGGYVHNYDALITISQKLQFLEKRGQLGPEELLTDAQINERYETYRHRILSEMHADEGIIYG